MMRQVVLDTETTGLAPEEGHRIIEIGCIELVDRKVTDNRFHVYINPEREIDEGALQVHGVDNEFLADKPLFQDIVDDFMNFIKGAEVIIHNAPFDVGFINHELSMLDNAHVPMEQKCTITDTLAMAKKKHPGRRNSLDALCKRYEIDNSHRELHGALLDAEILADVYLRMTGGQVSLLLDDPGNQETNTNAVAAVNLKDRPKLKVICCNQEEQLAHLQRLEKIEDTSGGKCLWKH